MDFLTNLEIAQLVWLIPLILVILYREQLRKSVYDVFQVFLNLKILSPIFVFALYCSLLLYLLQHFGLWSLTWWKETVIWFFGALVILFRATQALEKNVKFFKEIVVDLFSVLLVLEFLIGLYSFPLFAAILLVPIVGFLQTGVVVAEIDDEFQTVKKIFEYLLGTIGFVILVFVVRNAVSNWEEYFSTPFETFYPFILPVLLTIFILPFLYAFAVYMAYDSIFSKLHDSPWFAKTEIFKRCLFSLSKLNDIHQNKVYSINGLDSQEEIKEVLKNQDEETSKPDSLRKKIYWDLTAAEDQADVEAKIEHPTQIQDITSGFTFQNERKVIIEEEEILPGSTIEITGREVDEPKKSYFPDFRAKAFDNCNNLIAQGELLGSWLENQNLNLLEKNLERFNQLEENLRERYQKEARNKYGIDEETAQEISIEGVKNKYPTPEPPTIDEYLSEDD